MLDSPVMKGLSSRGSEATVGIYHALHIAGHDAVTADPDSRSLRSLLRDDEALAALAPAG